MLYKKGDRDDPRNYRPITLLNTDYKIFTVILAARLAKVIHYIASPENTGFVPNRFIVENAHLLKSLQARAEELFANPSPPPHARFGAAFVSLDQEKAFDRASWEYLEVALQDLNFGPFIASCIAIMYNPEVPPTRHLRINGYEGPNFPILSGVAQGDATSPVLYILFTEALTRLINNDTSWSGIPFQIPGSIRRHEHPGISVLAAPNPRRTHSTLVSIKLIQYADDTILCVAFPLVNLPRAFDRVNIYLDATGGKLNVIKCEGFLSGQARESPLRHHSNGYPTVNISSLSVCPTATIFRRPTSGKTLSQKCDHARPLGTRSSPAPPSPGRSLCALS